MKAVIQRVTKASVMAGEKEISSIGRGICVLLGISNDDRDKDVDYVVHKILNLRLFEDENGRAWCHSVMDKGLEVLCVSQFTLQCTLKGNKPDFHLAMNADFAQPFYNSVLEQLRIKHKPELIKDGQFGAYMQVHIQNDGPVTICLESPAAPINAKQLSKLEKQQQCKEKTRTKINSGSGKDKGVLHSKVGPNASSTTQGEKDEPDSFECED
ncbi:D-aminoacyl-tRNA deacylase 1 [Silurus meridionalis]|uniref:D-aminoacyl-tRNA deacylase n=1 Tax=Silurus meridionalis TaxID=175797 RepID=A0A8T0BZN3_SILME|nr:D-aminoacyl-tRNA deacylase 1 [Silurus meridionalis]KAF7711346.1 hypothetical protein HF521_000357 [Silurus meridionalis]KAI5108899.1 D-aminoacyl-tRNA deacylase 1 [Silurus meridionalis]